MKPFERECVGESVRASLSSSWNASSSVRPDARPHVVNAAATTVQELLLTDEAILLY